MRLTALDVIVVAAYLALLSWLSVRFSARQKSREEYFLGNRQMHWCLVGGSIMATLVSTVTYLSAPGEMIRYGIGFYLHLLTVPLIVPVVNRFIIPVYAGIRITSAYQYLEVRFDARIRMLAAVIFILRSLLWMGLITYTVSFSVAEMAGVPLFPAIFVLGAFTTLYTCAGGLRTVVWTDNIQLWILLGGAAAIPIHIWAGTGAGPWSWWETFSLAGRTHIETFSWDPTVRVTAVGTMLSYFLWNICTQGADQVAVQRYLSTPSVEAARRSVWMYAIFKIVLTLLLMASGLALFAFFASSSGLPVEEFQKQIAAKADNLMPHFIARYLPPGVSGLLLAAILAAAMSSVSSAVNSISAVVSTDFLGRVRLLSRWKDSLWIDKQVAAAAGAFGVAAASAIAALAGSLDWSLVELAGRVNTLSVGPLGVLFLAGIWFPRVATRAILLGFCAAAALSVSIAFGKELFGLQRSISFLWLIPASFLGGLAVACGSSLLSPRKTN